MSDENISYNEIFKNYNNILSYFETNKLILKNLIDLFSNISENFNSIGNKVLFTKNFKINTIHFTSFNDIIDKITQSHITLFQKFKFYSELLKVKIIDPLILFQTNYEKEIKNLCILFKEIIDEKSFQNNNKNNNIFNNNIFLNIKNDSQLDKIFENKYKDLCTSLEKKEREKNEIISSKLDLYFELGKKELNSLYNNDETILNGINSMKNKFNKEIINLLGKNLNSNEIYNNKYNNILNKPQKDIQININNFEIINNKDNNYKEIFYKFFYSIKFDTNVNKNILSTINELLDKNKFNFEFYQLFLQIFNESISIKSKSEKDLNSSLFVVFSFPNLVCLTNIINNIIENIKVYLVLKENQIPLSIFEEIVQMGEKTVSNNNFMCALLSKNKIFQNILIWKNSIFVSIIRLLIKSAKDYDEYKPKIENTDDDYITNLESTKICNYIVGYKNFSENKKRYMNEKLSKEIILNTVNKYLRHFGNYKFILDNPSDINEIILNDLYIDNQKMINYFINNYSIFIHSRKSEIFGLKSIKLKEKISLIKSHKIDIIKQKYFCGLKSNESNFIILKYTLKFLTIKENLNLMHLSKNLTKINKKIYKNLLSSNNNSALRLNIWKSCLKYKTYSSIFNYKQLFLEINKNDMIESHQKINEQIMKDLKRTQCRNKESLGAIFNILRVLAYSNNNVNYYQGLNLTCLFLYDFTKNEEETFTLINNLHFLTPFGDIIENKFQLIEVFCDTLEKLIYLFLPRIFSLFNENKIKLIYFVNPYLITLFTNVYVSLPENNTKFILYVWDNFLLNGWKSIFEIILAVLKCLEKKLLSLNEEDILSFLGNNMWKNEIFYDDNFEEFLEIKKKLKINRGLLNLINEKIYMEKTIKKDKKK